MEKLKLQQGEEVLASDFVEIYRNSLISYNAECHITNKRLFLLPKTAIDRITGKDITLPLSSISSFKTKMTLQIIVHAKGEIHLSGEGALRVVEHLQRLHSGASLLTEKIIFQSSTYIHLKVGLSIKGDLFLSKNKLLIRSKKSLENLLFPKQRFEISLTDIKNIEYSRFEKLLTIHTKKDRITIGGSAATKLNSILLSLDGSTVASLESVVVNFSAQLRRGAKPSINGDISITSKSLLFAPSSAIDTLTGVQIKNVQIADIQKLRNSSKLTIETNTSTLEFVSSKQNELFKEIHQRIVQVKRDPLFVDSRSKKYSAEDAQKQLSDLKLPFIWGDEVPILTENVLIQNSDQHLWFGTILMTSLKTIFLNHYNTPLWKALNTTISIVENRSSIDPSIELLTSNSRLKIYPLSNISFPKYYRKILMDARPSDAEKFAKKGLPVETIIGKTQAVVLSVANNIIHTIKDTSVKTRTRGLQIECKVRRDFPLEVGAVVDVEIPKATGRYLFQSTIVEEFITQQDPLSRHYLTLSFPSNISFYNDRSEYRAPLVELLSTELYVLPEYDRERDDVMELLPNVKHHINFKASLKDISVGGCSFQHTLSFSHFHVPNHRILIKFSMNIGKQKINLHGIACHEKEVDEDQFLSGILFINLNSSHRSIINQAVLKIEREELRKISEEKNKPPPEKD